MKYYKNIHEAYAGVLKDVYYNPEYMSAPRGLKIREKVDFAFRVLEPSSEPIITADAERNVKIAEYTKKEMELYNSGSRKVEDFAKASKFWEKLANPDGTINSAYGFLIWFNYSCGGVHTDPYARTPWEWAKESLLADKDTRQAVMHFALPEHKWMGNRDQVCTLTGNWLIRDDKLNLSIVMRSNDVVKGLAFDLPWFVSLMDRMLGELKEKYPTLQKGAYTHFAHSMHAYESDGDTIMKMIGDKQ
jgi:thymidylate synthase